MINEGGETYEDLYYLQRKEEDMLAQKEIPDGQKEEISQVQNFCGLIHHKATLK